jgi:hypothetical protein
MRTTFGISDIQKLFCWVTLFFFLSSRLHAQNTTIRGFVDALSTYEKGKLSFGFGEQDLFITSELTDRISFLGESVFKFDPLSPSEFSVSVERVVIKYNYFSNHNILIGKHHTPINYWNDTYHHGRVFFPTIERPLLFTARIIPLHTTGISFQGHNLGQIKFGYDLMVGNGLGSSSIQDNDNSKSITLAAHVKPAENLRIGASYYHDAIAKGAHLHDGRSLAWQVNQNLFTGSVAYFGKKFELLAESTMAVNRTDTTGRKKTFGSYVYAGLKIKDQWIPYIRFDQLHSQAGEIYFERNNTSAFLTGLRYQISYLAVVKLEYQHENSQKTNSKNRVVAQFAIGF